MTEMNTTQRRKPTRILAAALAIAMGATAIPATAFAASGDYDFQRNRDGFRQVQRHHRDDRDYRPRRQVQRYAPPPRDRRHEYRRHRHDDDDVGAAIAGAIFGIAIGTIIADGYNQSRYAPPSRTYYGPTDAEYAPPPAPDYAPEPFTDDWYAYCTSKYNTFDPQTGTFQPFEGPRKLCK